jgi:hypothetical protein
MIRASAWAECSGLPLYAEIEFEMAQRHSVRLCANHRESLIANYNYHFVTPPIFRANCRRASYQSLWNITCDFYETNS